MKLIHFAGVSFAVHALVLAGMLVRAQVFSVNPNDAAYIQFNEEKQEPKAYKPFFIGDENDKTNKMKPEIITNKEELAHDDEPSGNGTGPDSGVYIPSYQVEELPVPESSINPVYPEEARRTGVEGKVMVLLYIDCQGYVKKAEIQKSPNALLSESALNAVINAKFRPAKIGGIARAVCMQLTLKFHLE